MMCPEPVVSIIIPTWNRGDMLLETVESCITQEGVKKDIIVVDDGSTDGSIDKLATIFPDVRILKQTRQGACVARNYGLEHAFGEYVKFIDSDDKLAPKVLIRQVEAMKSSNSEVVYSDFEMFGHLDDPRVGGAPLRITGHVDDPVEALLGDWWCAPFCYLYRRESLAGIRWWEELECLQDFDFILKVAMSGKQFSYASGLSGYYRIHDGQITQSSLEKYAKNRCKVLDCIRRQLQEKKQWEGIKKQRVLNGYWSASRIFYKTNPAYFDTLAHLIEEESPHFSPEPDTLAVIRWMVRYLGIRKTEYLLSIRRKLLRR